MTPYEKLDRVLEYSFSYTDPVYRSFLQIANDLQDEIPRKELFEVLQKLAQEGYVTMKDSGNSGTSYGSSFDGRLLRDAGGYQKLVESNNTKAILTKLRIVIDIINIFVIIILTTLILLTEMGYLHK